MLERFIIFSLERCGSTALLKMLNLHAGIKCVREPFNPDVRKQTGKCNVRTPVELATELESIWCCYNGIKHVWHPSGWPFGPNDGLNDSLLTDGARRVIFLTRRNILKRVVSGLMSRQTGIYAINDQQYRQNYDNHQFCPVDLTIIQQSITDEKGLLEERRTLLDTRRATWIEIIYEELFSRDAATQSGTIAKILGFLDVGFAGRGDIESEMQELLNNSDHRMNNIATYSRIPNAREVEDRFGCDETGWLLADADPYFAPASSLPSKTGQPEGNTIIAESGRDCENFLTFGPYIHLVPGLYRITIACTYLAEPDPAKPVHYDFVGWKSSEAEILDEADIPFIDTSHREFTREIRIPEDGGDVFEVRTYYRGSGSFRIESVAITYLAG